MTDPAPLLPQVRRLEAVGARCWPSATSRFCGAWAIRLTPDHGAKRLNSISVLDPFDHLRIEERLAGAKAAFSKAGRVLTFRETPLFPPRLDRHLNEEGWSRFDRTDVMAMALTRRLPTRDFVSRRADNARAWIALCVELGGFDASAIEGVASLITRVDGELALLKDTSKDGTPYAACMAVRFNDMVGIFEVVSNPALRRQGHGGAIVEAALDWAASGGARSAWLQVMSDNEAAKALYRKLGFQGVYRYSYRRPPEETLVP